MNSIQALRVRGVRSHPGAAAVAPMGEKDGRGVALGITSAGHTKPPACIHTSVVGSIIFSHFPYLRRGKAADLGLLTDGCFVLRE